MTADFERIFAFTIELDRLKGILRKTKPVGLDRYENTAEHSWQVCLLALALTKYAVPPVDPVRVVELLLVHDIPEIDEGDQIIYAGTDLVRQDMGQDDATQAWIANGFCHCGLSSWPARRRKLVSPMQWIG